MLSHLVIRNFAIIEHLEIPFAEGFTVLTGETGAGKSIVIDALNLLLGGRASTDVIRSEEEQAVVEGIFEPAPARMRALNGRLEEWGLEPLEDQLIIRRIVNRNGRNKVFINGGLSTVSALAELTRGLVDISGQHEHYSLLDPEGHVDLLDNFAGLDVERRAMEAAWGEVAALRHELRSLRQDVQERLQRIDFLRYQLTEIDAAGLTPGESEALKVELDRLRHAEKLADAAQRAVYLCYEAESAAVEQISMASAMLEKAAPFDPELGELAARMDEVQILLGDVARDLVSYAQGVELDPARLDEVVERLELIKRLERKHGGDAASILERAGAMRQELDRLENAATHSQQLERRLEEAEERAFRAAHQLSKRRREAALRMQALVEQELADLNMARTTFLVHFEPGDLPATAGQRPEDARLGPKGFDRVEFLITPNVGELPKPLAKIASGGELSRIMLVIKSVLRDRDEVSTYVFDEVDTGIGGSTADMVGLKIAATAEGHQVLCITHLPQIASRSTHHYLVEKQLIDGRTQSLIRPLEREERVEEIARMLGGTRVTNKTLDAARELMQQ